MELQSHEKTDEYEIVSINVGGKDIVQAFVIVDDGEYIITKLFIDNTDVIKDAIAEEYAANPPS